MKVEQIRVKYQVGQRVRFRVWNDEMIVVWYLRIKTQWIKYICTKGKDDLQYVFDIEIEAIKPSKWVGFINFPF